MKICDEPFSTSFHFLMYCGNITMGMIRYTSIFGIIISLSWFIIIPTYKYYGAFHHH